MTANCSSFFTACVSSGRATIASGPPLRSACQACRARKIRCSGQIEGCDRCRVLSKTCIYVPRQKLGRPSSKPQNGRTARSGHTRTPRADPRHAAMPIDLDLSSILESTPPSSTTTSPVADFPSPQPVGTPNRLPIPHASPRLSVRDSGDEDLFRSIPDMIAFSSPDSRQPWLMPTESRKTWSPNSLSVPGGGHHHVCFLALSRRLLRVVLRPHLDLAQKNRAVCRTSPELHSSGEELSNTLEPMPHTSPCPHNWETAQQDLKTLDGAETFQLIETFFLFHPLSYLVNKTLFHKSQATQSSPGPLTLAVLAAASCWRQAIGTCRDDESAAPHSSTECNGECERAFSIALEAIYIRVDACLSLEMLQTLLIVIFQRLLVPAGSPKNMQEMQGIIHLAWTLAQNLRKEYPLQSSQQHPANTPTLASAHRRGSISQEDVESELVNFCWWTCVVFSLYSRIVSGLSPTILLSAMEPRPANAALCAQQKGSLSSKYDLQHRKMVPESVYASRLSTFVATTEICLLAACIIDTNHGTHIDETPQIRSMPPSMANIRQRFNMSMEAQALSHTDNVTGQTRQLLFQMLYLRLIPEKHETEAMVYEPNQANGLRIPHHGSSKLQGLVADQKRTVITAGEWDTAVTTVQSILDSMALLYGSRTGTADESCQRERFLLCWLGLEVCIGVFRKLSCSLNSWIKAFNCHQSDHAMNHDWQTWRRVQASLLASMHKTRHLLESVPPVATKPILQHYLQQLISVRQQQQQQLHRFYTSEMPQHQPQIDPYQQQEHLQVVSPQKPQPHHPRPQHQHQQQQPPQPTDALDDYLWDNPVHSQLPSTLHDSRNVQSVWSPPEETQASFTLDLEAPVEGAAFCGFGC
ncbi:uncharacterized protein SPPG_03061 [Spizellomyces punctatus DAOM BR117]|uniref:Zn(2)-C6 fungal-type domain-containing protein n=1 Tax=Spizellomyces punctatus (strain DAOM BR117) TaxID=645134 RepID=A0A0L0HJF7_SPIPD|nr:uncharacterized protein SPPG_03061 [Spizellomyces punctatus DAOM BR117]KND01247.1 hypothetical protein SPPG_03061 [Spizellomyces punctatus DAOM BR117]|eukprot:XP_016609286.1 hypothetical protein SPPG_03061 [Spizellomyces punctatus DAOM BR117]